MRFLMSFGPPSKAEIIQNHTTVSKNSGSLRSPKQSPGRPNRLHFGALREPSGPLLAAQSAKMAPPTGSRRHRKNESCKIHTTGKKGHASKPLNVPLNIQKQPRTRPQDQVQDQVQDCKGPRPGPGPGLEYWNIGIYVGNCSR